MTNKEKKEALENMLICYVDRTILTDKQVEETEDFVEELKRAINFTDSSTELKDKKVITFEEYIKNNDITKLDEDRYVFEDCLVSKKELMEWYSDTVENL